MTTLAIPRYVPQLADTTCREEVTIISEGDSRGLERLTPHKFRLLFPDHWQSPYPGGNVYLDAFERGTIDWLRSFGMLRDERDSEIIKKFSCGKYGGYSSPRASFRDGLLITEFVSLWLFWDDCVVEQGTRWSIDDMVSAMGDESTLRGDDGFMNAWHDLCVRLRQTQSATWMVRLCSEMQAWMENAKIETQNAQKYKRSGIMPDFDTMLDIRTVSIGMYPTFHLIEMTEGFELPANFHEHGIVKEMKRLASRLVGIGNDLGGLAKDLANGWPNLITALRQQANISLVDAFCRIVDMNNADVATFDQLEDQLPSWGSKIDSQIQGWIRAVRYSVVGFTLWESLAERYQNKKVAVDGRVLAAPVAFFHTPLEVGLGGTQESTKDTGTR
jgi:terpene synthase-like protein